MDAVTAAERIAQQMPLDRVQLAALADDVRARAHAARLERIKRKRLSRAADHWAD
jgi:hypothetical protein